MSEYRDSSSNNLLSLISGAFIGAAGLAWWLISEADKRKEEKNKSNDVFLQNSRRLRSD